MSVIGKYKSKITCTHGKKQMGNLNGMQEFLQTPD